MGRKQEILTRRPFFGRSRSGNGKRSLLKKSISMGLAFVMCLSGIAVMPEQGSKAKAADEIIISSAEDLEKIGTAGYPLDGDYVLAADIDLAGVDFTPIGGGVGDRGADAGANVFSGTFDGQGHVISNLTIQKSGSSSSDWQYGLFGIIGSGSETDKASVKNLILTGVDISVDMLGSGYLSLGGLAGEVNHNAVIDNIAITDGRIEANPSNKGDVVGAGGLIGEMRYEITGASGSNSSNGVTISNVFVGADVVCGSSTDNPYAAGIVGRIAKSNPDSISASVFTGSVSFKGSNGKGICGGDISNNINNCYYVNGEGTGTKVTESELSAETLLAGLDAKYWTAGADGCMMMKQCAESKTLAGNLALSELSFDFAEGDSLTAVTQDFSVPVSVQINGNEESISWSSNAAALSIGADGLVTVKEVYADTACLLTATVGSLGIAKTFQVVVLSAADIKLEFDQEYAVVGTPLNVILTDAPEGMSCTYTWSVDGSQKATGNTYTPTSADLEKLLTVTAEADGEYTGTYTASMYISKLPVIYINTEDGQAITSKEVYKNADMHMQGNAEYNSANTTLYDGALQIRGRGNSTWSNPKKPYKLKLDAKTDLFGFGSNKHWVLLANYTDESHMRNMLSYNLSGAMGMPYMQSVPVDLILNGEYLGTYQFCEQVKISKARVDIHDWEDYAEDVAKAVYAVEKENGMTKTDRDAIETQLAETDMSWLTTKKFTYNKTEYNITEYLPDMPDCTGGYLMELDSYYDEVSKFTTSKNQPLQFKSPEFIGTNSTAMNYVKTYINAFESAIDASDFTTVYQGEKVSYSQLFDMDSLAQFWLVNELFMNVDAMKKSTYMYKDIDGLFYMGPIWDMDWSSNSLVSESQGSKTYDAWQTTKFSDQAQANQWYKKIIKDPYFAVKAYDLYHRMQDDMKAITAEGGIMDTYQALLTESAAANAAIWYQGASDKQFATQTARLKTYLTNRINWMDQQFASVDTLAKSLGYSSSNQISVTADTSHENETTFTAKVTSSNAAKVGFYVNGVLAGTADVSDQEAAFTVSDTYIDKSKDTTNIVLVRAMNASGSLLSNISNYAVFSKDGAKLTGTVTIRGSAKVGSTLTAEVADTNNSGALSYLWKADGVEISGAANASYTLTEAEKGKTITVEVTSSVEIGTLTSEPTAAVEAEEELKNDHIIIHQVYGGGANDSTPISHSFIELYNPTDQEISLAGYSLGYLSNGSNGTAEKEVTLSLDGASLPARTSYLIRCEAQDSASETIRWSIDYFDKEWENRTIDNKQYRLILYNGSKIEDGVSVDEEPVEGEALSGISKQKTIRRVNFADTNNNRADFEIVSYRDETEEVIAAKRPRSAADGVWGTNTGTPEIPVPPAELSGTLSIRGNAIVGAILYADLVNTNNSGELSFQWKADGSDIAGATDQFFSLEAGYEGKTISVTAESSVETGALTAAMVEKVKAIQPQSSHMIIHQVYGGGGKKDTPISHSFIELYNPTNQAIDLDGYSIAYLSGETSAELKISGSIPARGSYLIRCGENASTIEQAYVISDEATDWNWDQIIDNKRYSIVLKHNGNYVDGVSVNEAPTEGTQALTDPDSTDTIISKNKSIRRINFIDTDHNVNDFEVLNYSKLPANLLEKVVPNSSKDGSWGPELGTNDPTDPAEAEKQKKEAVESLHTSLSDAKKMNSAEYTSESYQALSKAIDEAARALESNASLEEIQQAYANLQKALNGLVKKTDSSAGGTTPSVTLAKKGVVFKYKKGMYKITKSAAKGGTVTFTKPVRKTYKTVTIPATVTYQNITFRVTAIAAGALKGNKKLTAVQVGKNVTTIGASAFANDTKLKKIVIKSTVLKKVGKNALKGVSAKCQIKVPKKKLSKYKTLWKKRGQKSSVKVVK